LQRDKFIAIDVISKRVGTEVFVNVPKLVVDNMPWSEPPTRIQQSEKQGPTEASSNKPFHSVRPSSDRAA
jgi:hypothetical protein